LEKKENTIDKLIEKIIEKKFESFKIEIAELISQTGLKSKKKILNFEQACNFLDCSPSYLYKKTSFSEVPHFKKGKKLFFDEDELEQWLLNDKIYSKSEFNNIADRHLNKLKSKIKL